MRDNAALATTAGGVEATQAWQHNRAECASGIVKQGARDECIGVSDGSYAFTDSLKVVMSKIKAENDRVEKSGKDYVSVAYVEPLTTVKGEEEASVGA